MACLRRAASDPNGSQTLFQTLSAPLRFRGDDNTDTDWRLAAERIGAAVQAIAPRLLVFVEGVQARCSPVPLQQLACWGGALDSAAAAPVRLAVPNKLVYSPHVYGPGEHHPSALTYADGLLPAYVGPL